MSEPLSDSLPDLYVYFKGCWTFTRIMMGAAAAHVGDADGTVEFTPTADASVLHYKESGRLRLSTGQRAITFSRRFDYQVTGDMVHVAFADGMQTGQTYQSYRYEPSQRTLLPVDTHLCVLDRYDGHYQLLDANHFVLYTRIEGPHKDYTLHTHFTKSVA